jgi:phosphoribosylformimino-5-aminoimidazole carboxamide ribotide isomerase
VLEAVANHTDLKIDFTGGISTDGDISSAYEFGADYITASSIAITNPELFASWVMSFGREKITLSADVTDVKTKQVAFRGWAKQSELKLFEHLHFFYDKGLKYAKCTDISRDGVLEGPDFNFYQEILAEFPNLKVLASGGIRGVDDIRRLNEMGIFAVIFGKAFYEGILKLKDLEQFLIKS